ncbi:MAG: hypothetical protein HY690_09905 [Chloroflexi bacterium]|nr:hypothetical protein [Chloroflexota bacterium]
MQWLGSVSESYVLFVHKNLGISSAAELVASGKRAVFGDSDPGNSRALQARLFLKLLGADWKFVGGFGSSGDMRAAIRRGEINMTMDSLSGYAAAVVPMIQEGVVVPIAQSGLIKDGKWVRDPRVPEVPTYLESMLAVKGEAVKQSDYFRALELMSFLPTIARVLVYRAGVPPATVAAGREAILKAVQDPELRETYKKSVGIELIAQGGKETGDAAEAFVTRVKGQPQTLELLRRFVNEER